MDAAREEAAEKEMEREKELERQRKEDAENKKANQKNQRKHLEPTLTWIQDDKRLIYKR